MRNIKFLFLLLALPWTLAQTNFEPFHHSLILVDIDGTLGEQAQLPLANNDGVVNLGKEQENFSLYPGALRFFEQLLTLKANLADQGHSLDIALFTMGSGLRNEEIRDYFEQHFQLAAGTIRVFDYSNAVFSKRIIDMWKQGDPELSSNLKGYFDSLEKPIVHVADLENDQLYFKDLTNILPFYPYTRLSDTLLIDDNALALPTNQEGHLIVAAPEKGYEKILSRVFTFFEKSS